MPRTPNLIHLGDLPPGTPWLALACTRCERRGRFSVPRLLAEHGPDESLRAIRDRASADCPRRAETRIYELCGVIWPDLPRIMKAGSFDDRTPEERAAALAPPGRRR